MESRLEHLKDIGTDYFRNSLFRPKEKVVTYNRNMLAIAKKRSGATYYLDLTESCRIILIAPNRSGKTWILRALGDRLVQTDRSVVYLTDPKNEFLTSRLPVQPKFLHLLMEGEKPTGTRIVTLRPTFYGDFYPNLPKDNHWFSMNIKKMTKTDFMSMMNTEGMTDSQKTMMELVFQKLVDSYRADPQKEFKVEHIEQMIDSITEVNEAQKNKLKFRFAPFKTSKFLDTRYERDIVRMIQNGYVPAINLEGFDSFAKGSFNYPEIVITVALREIINARRAGKIRSVFIMIDEFSRFITTQRQNSMRQDVENSYENDARYGINFCIAVQSMSTIPPRILEQSRYIILPNNASADVIKECLLISGQVTNQQSMWNEALRLKQSMRPQYHEWCVIDRKINTREIIRPLAPLSFHAETTQ